MEGDENPVSTHPNSLGFEPLRRRVPNVRESDRLDLRFGERALLTRLKIASISFESSTGDQASIGDFPILLVLD
jgi:hypothetical protein